MFMFDLAKELGGMTVGWLKSNMSSYELSQWIEYYRLKAEKEKASMAGSPKVDFDSTAKQLAPSKENFRAIFAKRLVKDG